MTTRSAEEIDKFRKLAAEWWDPDGSLRGLHSMNGVRVPMVLEAMAASESLVRLFRRFDLGFELSAKVVFRVVRIVRTQ